MRVVSLFAGIGGFDLAFQRCGFNTVAVVEKDPNCLKLLKKRFPDAQQFDDVRTVGQHNLPECDLICGGFPCQDLSQAGKRAGLAGSRSGLFYEFARIVHECQPAFCIFENVPGLFSSDDGRDFARVLLGLGRGGRYSGAWRNFDAQFFGVAQRRRRIFGVFSRLDSGAERCAEILSLRESVRGHPAPSRETGQDVAGTLESRTTAGGFPGTDGACAGHVVAESPHAGGDYVEDGTASAMKARDYKDATDLICFSCKDHGQDASQLSPTLRSMNFDKSHLNGGGQVAVAFKPSHFTRGKDGAPSDVMPPLSADADKGDQDPVIFQSRIARNGRGQPERVCPTLNGSDAGATSDMRPILCDSIVRRLTPVECERLQGFPDGWTEGFSDSVRYRMLGNAVNVNVAEWIGRRMSWTPSGS